MTIELRLPISVKGILGPAGHVILLRNERDEWELPGGRLEQADATPADCLRREIAEELHIEAEIGAPVYSWRYEPIPGRSVFLVAYDCRIVGRWPTALSHSDEHLDVGVFALDELDSISLPPGYRDAIARSRIVESPG